MCGIACCIDTSDALAEALKAAVGNRGPDGTEWVEIPGTTPLKMIASVLHIQGSALCRQPCIDEDGNVLLWNGEIFDVRENRHFGQPNPGESDTLVVSRLLQKMLNFHSMEELAMCVSCIHGPWAMIYFHAQTKRLLYARDAFGRRSLCALRSRNGTIVALSSVTQSVCDDSRANCWEEVGVEGIHVVGIDDMTSSITPWPLSRLRLTRKKTVESFDLVDRPLAKEMPSRASEFLDVCRSAVSRRVSCLSRKSLGGRSTVGVLFSGGVDSVFLAALLHQCIKDHTETIDLINVSFVYQDTAGSPDRLAALEALAELRVLYPERHWNLVEVDVDLSERNAHTEHIWQLIQPSATIMDLNIGTAFWFLGRAVGAGYKSCCKALLVGIGADEQMAGYGRHRATFLRGGTTALEAELALDLERLWKRNLGRDDRCIADSGREAWFPFLDESVVGYLQDLKMSVIADFSKAPGDGDKHILREAARLLGLGHAATNVKRAVQFGSNISKLTNRALKRSSRKVNGKDQLEKGEIGGSAT